MKKNHIKKVLVGLGMAGSVAFGAGAATVVLTLPTPDIETPTPQHVCEGEKINVSKLPVCIDKANYGLIKSALKSKFKANNDKVDYNDFALHVGVLDNEIKKDESFVLEDYESIDDDLFILLTNKYL